ncbi:hypothetical protein KR084_010639 [Drosophila pseudotakahashii]|nr:hypothetical protein KR084_010639 [Drosophila pseudotakahashii]
MDLLREFDIKHELSFDGLEQEQYLPISRSRCATPDLTTPATYAHIADLKRKLSSGQYTLRDKRGRSKVWQLFAVIVDEKGDDIENFVACRNCYNVHKFQMSTSNLMKHKCALKLESLTRNSEVKTVPDVALDEETKNKVLGAVTAWSVYNCRPPSIVEDLEFVNLVNILLNIGATYGENVKIRELLPQPAAVARNISDIYERHQRSLLEELMAIRATGYSVALFVYTDKFQELHAVLTMHYIQESTVINRLLSVSTIEGDSPAGDKTIRDAVASSLQKFHMNGDAPIIVTENDENIKTAFEGQPHVLCINTQLNQAIDKVFSETPQLQFLYEKCVDYFKAFHRSGSAYYTPLDRIIGAFKNMHQHWSTVSTNILMQDNETITLTNVMAMIRILSNFENSLMELENLKDPTLHMVIPHLRKLRKLCSDVTTEDVAVESCLKTALKPHLECISQNSITKYHKIALLLFPPTNKLLLFEESEKQYIIQDCKAMMESFYVESDSQRKRIKTDCEYNGIFSDFITPRLNDTKTDMITYEINGYLSMQVVLKPDFSLLHWWKDNECLFPLLYKVSCKIFAIPASIAFARNTLLQARSLINESSNTDEGVDRVVDEIMFLNNNLRIV